MGASTELRIGLSSFEFVLFRLDKTSTAKEAWARYGLFFEGVFIFKVSFIFEVIFIFEVALILCVCDITEKPFSHE